jgi:NAD(P)H-dependent FMN reductase
MRIFRVKESVMAKILAFSGSNSSKSINQQLVHYATTLIEYAEVEVLSLIDFPAPIFGVDLLETEGIPQSMQEFHAKMLGADAFLVSTPEHNGSMPSVLKNTIDWLSKIDGKVFQGKPTVFLSTSTGARGGRTALDHILTIMPFRGAEIVASLSVPSFHANFVDGILAEPLHAQLKNVVETLEKSLAQN